MRLKLSAVTISALAVISLSGGACTSGATKVSSTSSSNSPISTTIVARNWRTVRLGRAELRVPRSWRVLHRGCENPKQPGTIWVGTFGPAICPNRVYLSLDAPPNTIALFTPESDPIIRLGPVIGRSVIDGLRAIEHRSGFAGFSFQRLSRAVMYEFPSLGVTVTIAGPLSHSVVSTITTVEKG